MRMKPGKFQTVLIAGMAVALTALSGFLYLWKNREVYLNDC